MTSLRQLLDAHAPVLLLDAASSLIQVGWLNAREPARWQTSTAEAGIGLFESIQSLGVDVGAAGALVFCEGPGSVLGVRTAAVALRTWSLLRARPVFAYSSLAVVAHALHRPEVGVIVDARRDSWHLYRTGTGLQRVATAALAGELIMPEHFRHWFPRPPSVGTTSYDLSQILPQVETLDLFRPTDAPDAFLAEEPSYVTWTPHIHRAPSAR